MIRNLEEFNHAYEGKTCFIIGAGPSIHFQNLEPLKQHVTIAVNSGYVAAPWANFFISDDWAVAHWSYFFRELRQSCTTIALLYETKLEKYAKWFGDRAVLFRHQKGINIPDRYLHDDPHCHIGETRTSVGSAIMVAHIMGCSKIVILGLDCCRYAGQRYFWQLSPELAPDKAPYTIPHRNDGVRLDRYIKCKLGGQVTDRDLVEISRTWDKFGKAVNKKCSVYNASEASILTVFPKIELDAVVKEDA